MVYMITPDKENRRGFVYIKIGNSNAPEKRLQSLQTGNPIKLKLSKQWEGGPEEELAVQWALMLLNFHVHYEWFEVPEVVFTRMCQLESITNLVQLVNDKKQQMDDTKLAIVTLLGLA